MSLNILNTEYDFTFLSFKCLFGVYYINVAGYTPQMWAPATLHHSSAEALPTLCNLIVAFWWTLLPLNWNVLFLLSFIKDLDLEYHLSPSYPAKLVMGRSCRFMRRLLKIVLDLRAGPEYSWISENLLESPVSHGKNPVFPALSSRFSLDKSQRMVLRDHPKNGRPCTSTEVHQNLDNGLSWQWKLDHLDENDGWWFGTWWMFYVLQFYIGKCWSWKSTMPLSDPLMIWMADVPIQSI